MLFLQTFLLFITISLAALIPQSGQAKDELTEQELQYLEDDPTITHKVTFQFSQKEEPDSPDSKILGEITMGMFGKTVPKTVFNFVKLANMTHGYGYERVLFHRIIQNFMIQGGDFQFGDGRGGHSIFEKGKFKDENFEINHNKKGRVSMANAGKDTNGSQFFITNTDDCTFLDGKHVVFGQVIGGFDTLAAVSAVKTNDKNRPLLDLFISNIKIQTLSSQRQSGPKPVVPTLTKPQTMVSDPNAKYTEVISEPSPNYIYLIVVILVVVIWFAYSKSSYKKNAITDIKDSGIF